jgi:hypothetical protein
MYITDLLGAKVRRYKEPPPPRTDRSVTARKVALIGSAPTLDHAPWHDPSWEIWAHATCHNLCVRVDRYFDLHPWRWITGKKVPGYVDFLTTTRTPVYLQHVQKEVPASRRYPKERILAEFRPYFTSHLAWMAALALTEGVTTIGLWGIHYEHDKEHLDQRPGCEYWVGFLEGRGVTVVIPEANPVCKTPAWLYGYESHEGKLHTRAKTGASPTQVKPDTPLQPIAREDVTKRARTDFWDEVKDDPDFVMTPEIAQAALDGGIPLIDGKPAW